MRVSKVHQPFLRNSQLCCLPAGGEEQEDSAAGGSVSFATHHKQPRQKPARLGFAALQALLAEPGAGAGEGEEGGSGDDDCSSPVRPHATPGGFAALADEEPVGEEEAAAAEVAEQAADEDAAEQTAAEQAVPAAAEQGATCGFSFGFAAAAAPSAAPQSSGFGGFGAGASPRAGRPPLASLQLPPGARASAAGLAPSGRCGGAGSDSEDEQFFSATASRATSAALTAYASARSLRCGGWAHCAGGDGTAVLLIFLCLCLVPSSSRPPHPTSAPRLHSLSFCSRSGDDSPTKSSGATPLRKGEGLMAAAAHAVAHAAAGAGATVLEQLQQTAQLLSAAAAAAAEEGMVESSGPGSDSGGAGASDAEGAGSVSLAAEGPEEAAAGEEQESGEPEADQGADSSADATEPGAAGEGVPPAPPALRPSPFAADPEGLEEGLEAAPEAASPASPASPAAAAAAVEEGEEEGCLGGKAASVAASPAPPSPAAPSRQSPAAACSPPVMRDASPQLPAAWATAAAAGASPASPAAASPLPSASPATPGAGACSPPAAARPLAFPASAPHSPLPFPAGSPPRSPASAAAAGFPGLTVAAASPVRLSQMSPWSPTTRALAGGAPLGFASPPRSPAAAAWGAPSPAPPSGRASPVQAPQRSPAAEPVSAAMRELQLRREQGPAPRELLQVSRRCLRHMQGWLQRKDTWNESHACMQKHSAAVCACLSRRRPHWNAIASARASLVQEAQRHLLCAFDMLPSASGLSGEHTWNGCVQPAACKPCNEGHASYRS